MLPNLGRGARSAGTRLQISIGENLYYTAMSSYHKFLYLREQNALYPVTDSNDLSLGLVVLSLIS